MLHETWNIFITSKQINNGKEYNLHLIMGFYMSPRLKIHEAEIVYATVSKYTPYEFA